WRRLPLAISVQPHRLYGSPFIAAGLLVEMTQLRQPRQRRRFQLLVPHSVSDGADRGDLGLKLFRNCLLVTFVLSWVTLRFTVDFYQFPMCPTPRGHRVRMLVE